MNAVVDAQFVATRAFEQQVTEPAVPQSSKPEQAFAELRRSVQAALATYANVHRGSGHNSVATTHLYEQARTIVLDYMQLNQDAYSVIFCTPRRAELLQAQLKPGSYQSLSSQDIGLPLGVRALAIRRSAFPGGAPDQPGGGTARLVARSWVIWARSPDKFEPGTPAVVNIIAFARALQLTRKFGDDAFRATAATAPADANDWAAKILYDDKLAHLAGSELLAALRQTLIGRDLRVPTVAGERPYINLDNGASTRTFTPIWDAVWRTWRQPAAVQQALVQEVRSICAGVLSAPPASYDVIYAANTTEAISLAAAGLRNEWGPDSGAVVLNTLLEHNSNELPWRAIPGVSLIRLSMDEEGFVDLSELETVLCAYNQTGEHGKQHIRLVTVSGASNVLGVYNDLAQISQITHRYGARLLVDAAQLVAHRPIDMEACGIDYLAFSGHKLYAPFGAGVLVAKKGMLSFSPAEWAQILASGEENVGGIAGLGKALLLLRRIGLDAIAAEERELSAQVLRGLAQLPGVEVYGLKDPDSPRFASKGGVIIFNVKDKLPSAVADELAACGGIGVRSGCHCAHLTVKRTLHIHPLLEQFQGLILLLFPRLALPGVVRVSLGLENSADDVATLLATLDQVNQQPKGAKTDDQEQLETFAQAVSKNVYASL